MNNFINDLAKAHQIHEGWYPTSRSWRNNNPGNLRAGPPADSGGFTKFSSYAAGFAALKYDLTVKINGSARSVNNLMKRTGKTYEDLIFLDYISIFAPTEDNNSPSSYCNALCRDLKKYGVKPDTKLKVLNMLVRQEIDHADVGMEVQQDNEISPEERQRTLERRAANAKDPKTKEFILRIPSRLISRFQR